MGHERRWDPCVSHRGDDVDGFLDDYFARTDRNVFLVAGAGFDPRTGVVATRLGRVTKALRALFIRENRPDPPQGQRDQAAANTKALLAALNGQQVEIEIFGPDGAVIGGRNVINILRRQDFEGVTDIIVDVSALSTGTVFPTIRYFVEHAQRSVRTANLHVFVAHDPLLDAKICAVSGDAPGYVHGFRGRSTLFGTDDAAKLWLPQLTTGRRAVLGRLYNFVEPQETCPILPFPALDPRLGDALAEEYLTEIENTWSVDPSNIVYADEGDPLDLYRTILRLDDVRRPVFAETGGSMLILSPVGSKVMALGALMAAVERDLPVAHVESIGYEVGEHVPVEIEGPNLIHIWLEGDVYSRSQTTQSM